ncbi:heme ABC transporter ATP-binding protein [Sinimarinibacterium sp. NLF-5-8]|uniref:heme ABC transporter ATP-binding protein n=1 Tax=Sinimarinibacterium sp. NLF-5-8 TaxID=2698684 RepID=UPI00137BCD9D|nr:heme ABC transporter ATP-binding protein [Sinimarinibacterium sp. NLF-5-8]QHS10949.1 heme ABC transporter ATP-binding protein [Sinimarinibacterium sp. NLF-5-8]
MVGVSAQLVAEHVSLMRRGRQILQDVSLHVGAGELVALIGPNGAGKSTLLRTLAGEWQPDQGRCAINGEPLAGLSAATLARHRAVLPQDISSDFPLRADDIIALGRAPWRRRVSAQTNRRVLHEVQQVAGCTSLGARSYATLSGGERQRVQLARVLAQVWDIAAGDPPRYVLLDEPTASLDIGHQQRLLSSVRQVLPRGIGALAVLHDLNLAATFADRLYLLHHGRLVAQGTPAQVLQRPLLQTIYNADLDVHPHHQSRCPVVLARAPLSV